METSPQSDRSNFLFREWKFSCDVPAGRQGIQPMQNGNEVYFYSGRVANVRGQYRTYAADFWKLDLDLMLWSPVELQGTYPPPCMNYSVALWNGASYLFGGCGDVGIFDSLYKFEFATGLWTQLGKDGGAKQKPNENNTTEPASTSDSCDIGKFKFRTALCWPPSRHAHTAVTYGDAMYIFGGSSRNAQKIRVDYNDVWRFDFLDQSWSQVWPILPKPSPRQLTNTNVNETTSASSTASSNSNTKNSDALPAPQPRSYHSAVLAGEFMFVFGGFWMEGKKEYYFNDSWIFEFASNTWKRLAEREAAVKDQIDDDQVKAGKERVLKLQAKMEPHQQNLASLNKQQKKQLQQQEIKLNSMQKELAVAEEFSRKCIPRYADLLPFLRIFIR